MSSSLGQEGLIVSSVSIRGLRTDDVRGLSHCRDFKLLVYIFAVVVHYRF